MDQLQTLHWCQSELVQFCQIKRYVTFRSTKSTPKLGNVNTTMSSGYEKEMLFKTFVLYLHRKGVWGSMLSFEVLIKIHSEKSRYLECSEQL